MSDPNPDIDADRLIRIYVKIRGAIQEVTKKYDAELETLKAQQEEIKLAIKDKMLALGESTTSIKTDYGTAMLQRKTRYYAQDWDAFKSFVVDNAAVDLLEKRIAQTNMARYLEDNPGLVPPGLSSQTEFDIAVRKPAAK